MATEDQQMEIDMVTAMFADHFEELPEDKLGRVSYAVGICHSGDDVPDLKVTVFYPAGYPEAEPADFLIESVSNKRRVQVGPCLKAVKEIAEESIGMHCVINVLQHVQTFLDEDHEAAEKATLAKAGKDLAESSKTTVKADPTIRMGNIVTPELFKEWQAKHLAAKAVRLAAEMKKTLQKSAGKMTGRQIWDVSIKDADWQLFEAGQEEGLDIDEAGYDFAFHDEEDEEDDGEGYDFGEDEEGEEETA